MRASYAVAFVLVRRRLVVRLRLFAPLRDKVTSSAQSPVLFRSVGPPAPRMEAVNPNRTVP
jgi:hypothetical protein